MATHKNCASRAKRGVGRAACNSSSENDSYIELDFVSCSIVGRNAVTTINNNNNNNT